MSLQRPPQRVSECKPLVFTEVCGKLAVWQIHSMTIQLVIVFSDIKKIGIYQLTVRYLPRGSGIHDWGALTMLVTIRWTNVGNITYGRLKYIGYNDLTIQN